MRAIVGGREDSNRGDFEPAARGQMFVCLAEDMVVVAHESFQFAPVDKVEGFVVGPDLFKVVDFEAAVRGDPF